MHKAFRKPDELVVGLTGGIHRYSLGGFTALACTFSTIAEGLLEYETLSGEEIKGLIRGEKPSRDNGDDSTPSRGSAVPSTGRKDAPKGGEAEGGLEPQPH